MMIAGLREKVVRLSSLTVNTTQRRRKWKMTRRKICSLNASLSLTPLSKRNQLRKARFNSKSRKEALRPARETSRAKR
jgi:hypothetical protein